MCVSAAMWSSISKIVYACQKEQVSPAYYGGMYLTKTLTKSFTKPIELIHMSEYSQDSLDVVKKWERSLPQ